MIVVGIVVWLAFGSPDFETSLLAVAMFVAGSELLLWRFLFGVDKKGAVGFERVKFGFKQVGNKLESMDGKITNIEKDVGEIRNKLAGRKK